MRRGNISLLFVLECALSMQLQLHRRCAVPGLSSLTDILYDERQETGTKRSYRGLSVCKYISTGESVGMAQAVRSICTSEGLVGFWHGNLAACAHVVPHKADLFRALDSSGRNRLPHASQRRQLRTHLNVSVRAYLDKLGDNLVYTGIISTFTQTLKEEGQRALFHGIGPTLFGALPYEGIKLRSYDLLPASYQMRWTQK
ncbi:hypothetical protein PsorP6_002621 [Peronosclerospora sorghi]|uniref:Uncharacterized protein n=1 Tax=Peronosclerospora sorghi TaxID=230839 RepID=A0ACC0WU39_9STRA|nr:hypothetical protein PsorP6_002621 [Peronosclerospora sorghi]